MQTYRVFNCELAASDPSDIVFYGPRWMAVLVMRAMDLLTGGCWDYQSEARYQRFYGRAGEAR